MITLPEALGQPATVVWREIWDVDQGGEGIGIPREKQSHLFERFFRVEGETQTTYPGLRLGLYVAAEFLKRHSGSIWLESEEGKGSTFSFSLPLAHTRREAFSDPGEMTWSGVRKKS